MSIDGIDAIELPFSLFPEGTVLLFPNCRVRAKSILQLDVEAMLTHPPNLDVLCFEQIESLTKHKPTID